MNAAFRAAAIVVALTWWLACGWLVLAQAQPAIGTLHVEVVADAKPIAGAAVHMEGAVHTTDAEGVVSFEAPAGAVILTVDAEGYVTTTGTVQLAPSTVQHVVITLQRRPVVEEEVTIVATTRTNRRLEDQPMRVEVLSREEVEEKMLMTPGDIVMMLNEMGGMRVQATSPSLGAASVRIQGMRGRYTRVLSDGLPLFGDVGGLGLLQIPPMDLGHVEVIKGVASALYGAGAMGGVINLVSRRPSDTRQTDLLINRSTRGATDGVGYIAGPLRGNWRASLQASAHGQESTDVNKDGWTDLPGYQRFAARPRLFWDDGAGRSLFVTSGATIEDRHGGTTGAPVSVPVPASYVEAIDTTRADVGAVGQLLFRDRFPVTVRVAFGNQDHDHRFGTVRERDTHSMAFGELAIRGVAGTGTWVAGVAVQRDAYRAQDVPRFDYTFNAGGLFAQYDVDIERWLSLSSSARVDLHDEYGTFVSPRVSVLTRAGAWTSRVSVGTGVYAPTPITEETEAAGLTNLRIDRPLRAERGLSGSLDLSWTRGAVSATATAFASRVSDPLRLDRADAYVLGNAGEPVTNRGLELLVTVRREPFAVTGSYTYVRARESSPLGRRVEVPLTPAHSAGIVGMWEREDAGRIGVEWYFTGAQQLEVNPYRERSRPYSLVGLLAEKTFGRVRLFVNGENLTDVRQTRWDPLLRPGPGPDGRWTVDAWAPLEGRTINGGVRLRF